MEGGWGGLGLGAWAWARGFRSLLHSRTGGVFGLPPRLQTGNNYSHFAGRDWVRLSAGIDSDELPGVLILLTFCMETQPSHRQKCSESEDACSFARFVRRTPPPRKLQQAICS